MIKLIEYRRSGQTTAGLLSSIADACLCPGNIRVYVDHFLYDKKQGSLIFNRMIAEQAKELVRKLELNQIEITYDKEAVYIKSNFQGFYTDSDGRKYQEVKDFKDLKGR